MSHYSYINIKIRNPNIQLLKRTVEEIARELNGEVVSEISDYYGRVRRDFLIGIKTKEIYRGVGVKVVDGEVKLVGDFYGFRQAVNNLQKMLVQYYTKNAMIASLQKMGYQSISQAKVKDKIVIKATGW